MGLQEIFIENLRKIRKEKNITQEKLAEKCFSDTAYIGQIESGRRFPSIQFIEKLADALGIKAYVLFMDVSNKYPMTDSGSLNVSENCDTGSISDKALTEIYEIIENYREYKKRADDPNGVSAQFLATKDAALH